MLYFKIRKSYKGLTKQNTIKKKLAGLLQSELQNTNPGLKVSQGFNSSLLMFCVLIKTEVKIYKQKTYLKVISLKRRSI